MNLLNPFRFATAGPPVPSYANPGGTGNRSSLITASQAFGYNMLGIGVLIDGNTGTTGCYLNSVADGDWFQFDFGSAKVIDEVTWYQQTTATHGTWKIQGSNDNSSFTDIGSSFTLGGATTQTITEISGNSTGYRYYRFTKVSGSIVSIWLYEVEFQIDDA